jgi:uncharacterized protein (TIGR03086 family)
VFVPLSADETFALVTRPDRLRRWQAITARVDLRAGGEYRWTIIPGHTARGTCTEVEPGKRVVFSWGWEGADDLPPGASTVIITLEPAPGGTVIRLVHEGVTDEQAASHAEGWTHYLGRLAEAAVKGDAGPDEWGAAATAAENLNAISCAAASLAVCQRVLTGIGEADYARATGCPEFTVAQLADHLTGSVTHLGTSGGAVFPVPGQATPATLEERIADAGQIALEAWDARGSGGTVSFFGSDVPAVVALSVLSLELLVHAWDFARATGQDVTVPEPVAAFVLDAARTIISPEIRVGRFGQELPANPDAGALDRLIAFTGRPG